MIVCHSSGVCAPKGLPPAGPGGSVTSVGVFDGVHLGHQAILSANRQRARELGARSTVVTFGSHPKKVLLGHSPRTLTSLEHRLELFRRAGIELAVVLEFDEELRSTPAERFANELLIQQLGTRAFVLGFDSKFGEGRRGTPQFLRDRGYDVQVVDKVDVDGRAVSSTAIREAVELGDLEGAARMLGRAVSVFGDVIHGQEVGRKLGFPTANLDLHHELHPPPGVYACRVRPGRCAKTVPSLEGAHPAVCNIGFRPTVQAESAARPTVEVHLLDFEGDLYDSVLETEFVSRLRSEQRFDGLEALKEQIGRDIEAARQLLRLDPLSPARHNPAPPNGR